MSFRDDEHECKLLVAKAAQLIHLNYWLTRAYFFIYLQVR